MTLFARSQDAASVAPWVEHIAVLRLGFRPFFLLAAVASIVDMLLWLADFQGFVQLRTYYGNGFWHGHEMVFGYAAAVIAGFLLTAVRNWTSEETPRGASLAALAGLWLIGRFTTWAAGYVPPGLAAIVDGAFLPVLAASLARPLWRRWQTRNFWVIPVLLALATANVFVHRGVATDSPGAVLRGLYLGVDIVVLLIIVIAGRVMPFFTARALPEAQPRTWKLVEWGSVVLAAALPLLRWSRFAPHLVVVVAGVSTAVHAVRLWGWGNRCVWKVPLLWILYLGYGWLVVGYALTAASAAGIVPQPLALHAFTAGAIGTFTLGMMVRVTLGHTGRPLVAPPLAVVAFACIQVAAVLRVFAGWGAPANVYAPTVLLAGAWWVAAFVLFLLVCGPMLVKPRVDGADG